VSAHKFLQYSQSFNSTEVYIFYISLNFLIDFLKPIRICHMIFVGFSFLLAELHLQPHLPQIIRARM